MGTNYYLKAAPPCAHCGRGPDLGIHIGKSSSGWCFALHIPHEWECEEHGVPPIKSLDDWLPLFERGIVNEYGEDVTPEEMIATITKRAHPDGLLRRDVGRHCIAHGPGTWDLIPGEFS